MVKIFFKQNEKLTLRGKSSVKVTSSFVKVTIVF